MSGTENENTSTVSIKLNGETPIKAKRGERLLFALRENGIMLQSACGGRGMCGLCKIKITNGGGPITPEEQKKLRSDETESGIRLACRIILENDITAEIDPAKLKSTTFTAEVEKKIQLNHDTVKLKLALEKPGKIHFTAGQYIQLEIPVTENAAQPAQRSYSLASPPANNDYIELIIRRVPNGLGTGYVHDILRQGDKVKFAGPNGDFHLRPTTAPALMLAGGSGISPFRAILADVATKKLDKPITLIFGGVRKSDLYELDHIIKLGTAIPGFRFIPALSKPADDDGWTGETGLVTEIAMRTFPDMSGMEAYLCGSPGMIGACVECFKKAGIDPSKIYYDQFA